MTRSPLAFATTSHTSSLAVDDVIRTRSGRLLESLPSLKSPSTATGRQSALQALEDPSQIGSAPVFEPIVNIPALASFLFIASVFSLLILRVNQVERAVVRRKGALEALREVKAKELGGDDRPETELVERTLKEYEQALLEEEKLRTLVPGVRIVAPNGPASNSMEDLAAVKQFGLNVDLQPPTATPKEQDSERKGLSNGAVAVLAVVALSQLALLYMLSFDPMVASGLYTTLGGAPPANIPLSSW